VDSDDVSDPQRSLQMMPKGQLQKLIDALRDSGHTVIGPRIEQQAIVYDEIESVDELPRGWHDQQTPGKYRLTPSDQETYFSNVVGPVSWKKYLFPPRLTVASADRTDTSWQFSTSDSEQPKYAFLGVRACDLAAIAVQDRVFLGGPYIEPVYQQRRERLFVVAVNCTTAASTCFCTSMGTGPKCDAEFDLALTEIDDGFVIEIGSEQGAELAERLDCTDATPDRCLSAQTLRQRAVEQISRSMDTSDLRNLLLSNLDHPQWDDVASRCLSCTNCTMVCPTCFCSSVSEVADLEGTHVDRVRQWDSCFNIDFSYMAGGTVNNDTRGRYRQWLTHKLASWHDQFDSSGCVGCGRCITWCPVGIELTEEVAAIRSQPTDKRHLPVVETSEGASCVVQEKSP
jgi:sulfhydrogenase subunit beta (sulfur reductase)